MLFLISWFIIGLLAGLFYLFIEYKDEESYEIDAGRLGGFMGAILFGYVSVIVVLVHVVVENGGVVLFTIKKKNEK